MDKKYVGEKLNEIKSKKITYLALGDSYTIGQSVSQSQSFPFQLADSLNTDFYIDVTETRVIAQTGWTTADLKANIAQQTFLHQYDLVSILIGVNNQYQGLSLTNYRTDLYFLIQKAIELAGGDTSKVFMISIPDYGYTPFGAASQTYISQQIDIFNAANKQYSDYFHITYFDITPITRNNNAVQQGLLASDGLHPSGKMYKLWVDAMYNGVRKKIK